MFKRVLFISRWAPDLIVFRDTSSWIKERGLFIHVVFKNIGNSAVVDHRTSQGAPAGSFQSLVGILLTQAKYSQAAVIGLFVKKFRTQYSFYHFKRVRTDSNSQLFEVFCIPAFSSKLMTMVGSVLAGEADCCAVAAEDANATRSAAHRRVRGARQDPHPARFCLPPSPAVRERGFP